jgi:predicted AAA+ superfamily ATPase
MNPWFKNVTPHKDIQQGILDEAIFAANLGDVASGIGREVYNNPEIFFAKTFLTLGLKTVATRVVKGLNGGEDAGNRTISLQTGFGGGKTHTLISIYHIAKLGKKLKTYSSLKDISSLLGEIKFNQANVAVFTNTTCDPTQGRKTDGLHIKTIWGEIAYQLGGKIAYKKIEENDQKCSAPKGLFKEILNMCSPALILIDELADYCVSASGVQVGNSTLADQTISFMQELSEAISSSDKCILIATLPASPVEVASSSLGVTILNSLIDRLARVSADTKPVSDEEIYEVIRRRLFEDVGDGKIIDLVASEYMELYQSLWAEIPQYANKGEYKEKIKKSYPFHPELIEMFQARWASHHDFQRTRGVLRLLASISSDLWKRQNSLTGNTSLIHSADINFANLDALSSQLKKLYGNGYEAVIAADVSGSSSNSFYIDKHNKEFGVYNLAQGITSTILLGSFGSAGANKGLSIEDIKLNVLRPDSFNHNTVNSVLDKLESNAHYLYYSSAGTASKRYWFHTKPNINILINQAKSEIKNPEIENEIVRRIIIKTGSIRLFNVLVNPSDEIPEQTKPTLIILGPKHKANVTEINGKTKDKIIQLATKKGNSERIYRNTLLFLLCNEIGSSRLYKDINEYLACTKIRDEYKSQLEYDQLNDLKNKIEEFNKASESSICTSYSIIAKHISRTGIGKIDLKQFKDSLDQQININIIDLLKKEEWLLDSVGLSLLKKNNLFPTVENPIRTKEVYEAFIRFDDKPMISSVDSIQNSIQKYCNNGEFAIAAGEPNAFKNIFYKETVPFFEVTDTTYWLVDKSIYEVKTEVPGSTGVAFGPKGPFIEPKHEEDTSEIPIEAKILKSVTISGKIAVENYNQIFTSFIQPLLKNNIEIKIEIKGKTNQANPISENSIQYKITKESAKQLGLRFEEEE